MKFLSTIVLFASFASVSALASPAVTAPEAAYTDYSTADQAAESSEALAGVRQDHLFWVDYNVRVASGTIQVWVDVDNSGITAVHVHNQVATPSQLVNGGRSYKGVKVSAEPGFSAAKGGMMVITGAGAKARIRVQNDGRFNAYVGNTNKRVNRVKVTLGLLGASVAYE